MHRSRPTTAAPRTKWSVLLISLALVLTVASWSLFAPEQALNALTVAVAFTSDWFGWFMIALATASLVFVLVIGYRYRHVRLGRDDERPAFSNFSWAAMLFAAGIGTDLMFYAVAEPVNQYMHPPQGTGETLAAAKQATVWTIFHYGPSGWGMYVLMGVAMSYAAYRKGLPLAVRSTLRPVLGRRTDGPVGVTVDVLTVVATIFGIATSLGIGVVMLNVGLDLLFGIPQGVPAQLGLIVLAIVVASMSAVSGVEKGIRLLSRLNVALSLALAGWLVVTGDTTFLLRSTLTTIGDFVSMFPGMTLDAMAYDHPAAWMQSWTLFFWAWWIAWASFVGMFLARISRGRTIGQFVFGALTIPLCYIIMWVATFGSTAVQRIRAGHDLDFAQLTMSSPEAGFFAILQQVPLPTVAVAVALFLGLLFYVTSADSGALVMANLTSHLPTVDADARPTLRFVWATVTGLLTIAMLTVDGIPALTNATIIMGLPFGFVMVLAMVSLHRLLKDEIPGRPADDEVAITPSGASQMQQPSSRS